jgi:Fic family protein
MSEEYKPPFQVTEEITDLTIEIGQYVGSVTAFETMHPNPVLRRENRIRTIHSSLAIEQNTLTLDQVTDLINGKRILGPPQDIREVKNAYEVYERAASLDPYSINDLLRAHKMMMVGLVKEAGVFRSGNVGVYAGTELIHMGTPANYVPELMEQLFSWLKKSKYHPLIKSCVFHFEFEFIHPFMDGNGRMGRLWQSLILQSWQQIFAWLPIETLVHENQDEYYRVLQLSDNAGDSTVFVEFMLRIILKALKELSENQTSLWMKGLKTNLTYPPASTDAHEAGLSESARRSRSAAKPHIIQSPRSWTD